jgi:quercetin dioxygenase-like cupin family protein
MTIRISSRAGLTLGAVALLFVSSLWTAGAQQPPAATGANDPANFTGKSESLPTTGINLSRRSFEPSARANWHVHDSGQLLFVQEGGMRVQVQGQKMRELKKGESAFLEGGVAHWHGAIPGQAAQQISVTFAPGIKWMEAVTDQQYAGTTPRK